MNISSDRFVDWNNVPELGGKVPSGIVQWRILDFEEKMTQAGVKDDGTPKVPKLMYAMSIEGIAPEEALGLKWTEYFVIGSDSDPIAQQTQTLYESIGIRQLKGVLTSAQVPWSNSIVSTLSSAVGAMYLQKVDHKLQKRRDNGEDIAAVVTGRTFKIGEAQPQYIPCLVDICTMCVAARSTGKGAPVMPTGLPVAGPPVIPQNMAAPKSMPPVAPPTTVTPANPPQPVRPVSVPLMPSVNNTIPAPGIPQVGVPIPPAPPIAPAQANPALVPGVIPNVNMPSPQMPVPSNAGIVNTMPCGICGQQVAFSDIAAHMAAHQPQTGPQFKQEA